MVKVFKKGKELTIPAGSVHKFLSSGWSLEDSDVKHKKGGAKHHYPIKTEEFHQPEEEESDEEIIEVDPEELASRDLSELDMDELKILAEYKGLDTSGLNTTRKLRAALEALE